MRYHINNTSKPITYKVWTISTDKVTTNHLHLLKQKGVPGRCVFDNEWFDSANGKKYSFAGHGSAEFDTTTQEQESLLLLIYGKDLILKSVEVVLPNQMSWSDRV